METDEGRGGGGGEKRCRNVLSAEANSREEDEITKRGVLVI